MAVTVQYSTQYTAEKATPKASLQVSQTFGLQALPFDFTQSGAGDATSTIYLRRLPPGIVYFFPILSKATFNDTGSTSDMDFGHAAYTAIDGTTVAANVNIFDDAVDVSGQNQDITFGSDFVTATLANNGQCKKFSSLTGVDLFITINTSTIQDATQIHGYLIIGTTAP